MISHPKTSQHQRECQTPIRPITCAKVRDPTNTPGACTAAAITAGKIKMTEAARQQAGAFSKRAAQTTIWCCSRRQPPTEHQGYLHVRAGQAAALMCACLLGNAQNQRYGRRRPDNSNQWQPLGWQAGPPGPTTPIDWRQAHLPSPPLPTKKRCPSSLRTVKYTR